MLTDSAFYPACVEAAVDIVDLLDVHPGSGRALLVGRIAFLILEKLYAAERLQPAPAIGTGGLPCRN